MAVTCGSQRFWSRLRSKQCYLTLGKIPYRDVVTEETLHASDSIAERQPTPREINMEKVPILFVDDDASYLQLIKRIVDENGVPAYYAACGKDALEILRVNRCELMVTDLNMPGMDGNSLARLARKQFPDLRIILDRFH